MSFFENIQENDQAAPTEDRTGGGYQPLESGVYKGKITQAYGMKSQRGAMGVRIEFELSVQDKPRKYTQTYWITNAQGSPTYERDGKQYYLAGFNHVNAITHLLCNKAIRDMTTKDVNIKIGEKLEPVPMMVELIDKPVALAILKVRENKRAKVNDEYVATNEEQFVNDTDYVFNAQGLTHLEWKNGQTEPKFIFEWKKVNDGNVRDKFKEVKEKSSTSSSSSTGNIDFA